MRKFIVSDLYGDKDMYDIILSYLEELDDDIFLILNGNMIGRNGFYDILLDIMFREKDNIQIEYLGGNLEFELYQRLKDGQLKKFLGNLNTFYLFRESLYQRKFLAAHGDVPKNIYSSSKIKDNNSAVFNIVGRRSDMFDKNFATNQFMGAIGHPIMYNPACFLIKGGVPIQNEDGFFYNSYNHSLTIDGGCGCYLNGDISFDHVPLVEIFEDSLMIRIFNHEGDIIHEYNFDGDLHEVCKCKVKRIVNL